MPVFVLDTSAVLTILNSEEGVETVLDLLDKAKNNQGLIYLPFMVLMELEYLLLRKISPEETMGILALVRAWPIQVEESTEDWGHQAAKIKSLHPISVADAWIASLALLHNAELVHKDPEYDQVGNLNRIALPYKPN
jgi:predicted nucleic acid-binding protein